MFAGNVSEATTLQKMLADLGALPGATVVMDAGIAAEANLVWLKLHGHPYVVVSRKQARQFDCDQVIEVGKPQGNRRSRYNECKPLAAVK